MCITVLNTKPETLSLHEANGNSRELGLERFPSETGGRNICKETGNLVPDEFIVLHKIMSKQ